MRLAPAAYAAHTLPFEIFLLVMLLEEHMAVMRSRGMFSEVFVPQLSFEKARSYLM